MSVFAKYTGRLSHQMVFFGNLVFIISPHILNANIRSQQLLELWKGPLVFLLEARRSIPLVQTSGQNTWNTTWSECSRNNLVIAYTLFFIFNSNNTYFPPQFHQTRMEQRFCIEFPILFYCVLVPVNVIFSLQDST